MHRASHCRLTSVVLVLGAYISGLLVADEATSSRVAWDQSTFVGSPDPPLPYRWEQAFPIEFSGPVSLHRLPERNAYLVCEERGKIFYFDASRPQIEKILLADLAQSPPPALESTEPLNVGLLSLTFHPQFATNHWVYVCYVAPGDNTRRTHISRFELHPGEPPQFRIQSEQPILTCDGGGHNGCTLLFGNDGYLYISIGDLTSPNPPDERETGQDISDLYASILRIDVDSATADRYYAIPSDNPFVHLSWARPEVYAYGLRNPFRMSVDRETGDLWVGDVGWEAYEMIYRVRPGGNYGWAIKEGPGDVKQQPRGPTPILPADIALSHAEAASVTGGLVYRGKELEGIYGQYVFGDWITRKFWAATFDSEKVTSYREIAAGRVKPVCFETDPHGELLVLDYSEANQSAGIYRLVPNSSAEESNAAFPRLLSQSGLFRDTSRQLPAAGVAAYSLNAPAWMDGAEAGYLLAIPGQAQAEFYQRPQKLFNWFRSRVVLPTGSVLAKTYYLPSKTSSAPVETQISLKEESGDWAYYSYRWNADGSDAELVDSPGETVLLPDSQIADGRTSRQWTFGSRTSCRICHTPWTGETVGFVEPQLRRPHASHDSWRELLSGGWITPSGDVPMLDDAKFTALVEPDDVHQPLDLRARSYLHTNCAHCHLNGGNASTAFDISFEMSLADTHTVDEMPLRGDLGIPDARIVAAGEPARSILLYRVAKTGQGRMPHVGATTVDPAGIVLLKQWIAELHPDAEIRHWKDQLAGAFGRPLEDSARVQAADQLLGSLPGAFELASLLAADRLPSRLVDAIVQSSLAQPAARRDLIEPYFPEELQIERLGTDFDPAEVLELPGDAARGKALFASGIGNCSSCHRLHDVGKQVGPELITALAKLKTPAQLLENIVQPSANIDEAYRASIIVTEDGQTLVGRILSRVDGILTLQDAAGNTTELNTEQIEFEKPSLVSLMPENLLAPLTAQQAADLLTYLDSVRN